jgi:hypothetical protein
VGKDLRATSSLTHIRRTGRVCVPVEVSKVDDFEPTAVPTVGQLLRELDRPAGNTAVKGEDGQDEARKLEHGKSTLSGSVRLGSDFHIESMSRL